MLFISNYIYPFLLNMAVTGLIYGGILFISGKFMPEFLSTIYIQTNIIVRTIIAVLICTTPANIAIALMYKHFSASVVSITNIISVVLVLTIVSILVDNIKINLTIIASLVFAVIACALLMYNLTK